MHAQAATTTLSLYTLSSDLPQTHPASHAFPPVAILQLVVVFVAAAAVVVVAAIDGHAWSGELKRALPRPGLRAAALLLRSSPDAIHQHDRLAHRSRRRAGGGSSVVQPVLLNTERSNKFPDKIPYHPARRMMERNRALVLLRYTGTKK